MSRFRVLRVQEDIGRLAMKARGSEGEMMMSSRRRLSVLLVGVAMMSGCFEDEGDAPSLFDGFFQDESREGNEDCDPYLGDCEGAPLMGMHDSGVLDGGSIDAGCEDSATPPPPDCDPYSEECEPVEPMEPAEPPFDPETGETECDPYTGDCETPDEPGVPEDIDDLEPTEPSEPEECDPYVDVCTPPAN